MNIEELFLWTLEDLEKSITSNDPYTVLHASALLRKLLLDDYPLLDQVNQNYRLKIEYEIIDNDKFFEMFDILELPNLEFLGIQDAFDPDSIPNPPIKIVKRDAFLNSKIQISGEKVFTVREVIQHQSNVRGGVHAGKPKNDDDKALSETEETISIMGVPAGLRQLKAIGRVVLKSLHHLRVIVLCNEAIKLDPDQSPAYYNRGTAFAMSNKLREAILDFDKVIEIEPSHSNISDVYYNRGHTFLQLTVMDFEKYLQHAPESPEREMVATTMEKIRGNKKT